MLRRGEISTEVDRKPLFFTIAALAGCTIAAVLIFVLGKGDALGIFAGVLLTIVAVAAAVVLFAMLTDRAYIDGNVLHLSYMFKRADVPVEKIGKVTYKDDVYYVFDKNDKVLGTINGRLTGIDRVILALDKRKVPFV